MKITPAHGAAVVRMQAFWSGLTIQSGRAASGA